MTQTVTPSVIITITLPSDEGEQATLLIQRGDLAHMRQFVYTDLDDVSTVLHEAANALLLIESDPPTISEATPPEPKAAVKPDRKPEPQEPTIDVPLKKAQQRSKSATSRSRAVKPMQRRIGRPY